MPAFALADREVAGFGLPHIGRPSRLIEGRHQGSPAGHLALRHAPKVNQAEWSERQVPMYIGRLTAGARVYGRVGRQPSSCLTLSGAQ